MKWLGWYSILFIGFNIALQVLAIGKQPAAVTPFAALMVMVLSIPVLALAIQVIMKGRK